MNQGHYYVIKNLKGFYGSNFYCERCEKPYADIDKHYCPDACNICQRLDCSPGIPQRCDECERLCRSSECFSIHKAKSGRQELSICDKVSNKNIVF